MLSHVGVLQTDTNTDAQHETERHTTPHACVLSSTILKSSFVSKRYL